MPRTAAPPIIAAVSTSGDSPPRFLSVFFSSAVELSLVAGSGTAGPAGSSAGSSSRTTSGDDPTGQLIRSG